jgi:scavenger receptor class B protein 1
MELVYQRPGVMQGIPLYRYVAPKTLFANGSDYAPNEGFCPCRQSGILNVSSCRHSESSFETLLMLISMLSVVILITLMLIVQL